MAQEKHPTSNSQEHLKAHTETGNIQKQSVEAAHNTLSLKEQEPQNQESLKRQKEKLKDVIEQQALTKEDYQKQSEANKHDSNPHRHYLTRKTKINVYHQTMDDVRSHLTPTEQRFSKIIHNDTVEAISDFGSKTIARPSGILGGATILVFGSFIVLFFAKRYGFEVPLSLFAALYIVGFIAMVTIEIIYKNIIKITQKS